MPPETCPNCGAEVPSRARACPECGSDDQTGWSEDAPASSLNLPDAEAFDYDDFVQREFSREKRPRGIHWFWWAIAIVIVALFITGIFWVSR